MALLGRDCLSGDMSQCGTLDCDRFIQGSLVKVVVEGIVVTAHTHTLTQTHKHTHTNTHTHTHTLTHIHTHTGFGMQARVRRTTSKSYGYQLCNHLCKLLHDIVLMRAPYEIHTFLVY